ncbi:MAG: ABC transporter permease subunit [Bacilli bacterium]|nr:ABC transporter permease subunit [Bacilli bacterium]
MKDFELKVKEKYLAIKDKFIEFDDRVKTHNFLKYLYYPFRLLFLLIFGILQFIVVVVYQIIKWIAGLIISFVEYLVATPTRVKENFKKRKDKWKTRRTFKEWIKRQAFEWKVSFKKDWIMYLLYLPVFIWLIVFRYLPKFGLVIAFKNYNVFQGVIDSPWAGRGGFEHFYNFFNNPYFGKLLSNTLMINVYSLLFVFPLPIILALMLNEVRVKWFKNTTQTVVFLPYFISTVIVVSIFTKMFSYDGIINSFLGQIFGMKRKYYMSDPTSALIIYYLMGIYTGTGFSSLIYVAALTSIDPHLYEAAKIDGASKMQEVKYITLPGIMPTVMVMLILRIGKLLNVGYETIILIYQPTTYDTLDVISTYVYRLGIEGKQYSFASAVDVFNAVIALLLVTGANKLARRTGSSLW